MSDATLLPEADQDRILVEMHSHLRDIAAWFVHEQDMDDVVQVLITRCLVRYRSGHWTRPPRAPRAFAWRLLVNHIISRYLRRMSVEANDAEHLRERTAATPAWMSPDRAHEEEAIVAFHKEALTRLTPRCREVYRMVREEGSSYAQIATRLGIGREAVHSAVRRAQQALRGEVRRMGIAISGDGVARRPRRAVKWGNEAHFQPEYPAGTGVEA